jgi:hypothetical protein
MSRDASWLRRDHDLNFLMDDAVMNAVERLGLRAIVAYTAVLDASWAAGKRVTLPWAIRRLPRVYDLGDTDDLVAGLVEAGLLDPDGGIRASSWETWFLPAQERRAKRSQGGVEGNARRWGDRNAIGMRSASDRHPNPQPAIHPSIHPVARVRARENGSEDPTTKKNGSLKETLKEMGLLAPEEKEMTQ